MQPAVSVVAQALAGAIAPDPIVDPVEWARKNLIVPDGIAAGTPWDDALTPYLREILRLMSTSSPETLVAVRKSAQVGFTLVLMAWAGYVIDVCPAKMMVVFPTIELVQQLNREKLQPTIEQTPCLDRKVREVKSRSSAGSTMLNKRFPGGSLVLAGANSSAGLRMLTIKFMGCDEVDDWPADLAGQGDPMVMVGARQDVFRATGDFKKLVGSTPTIKGQSRIEEAFDAGDRRFYHVPCPECRHRQRLVFKNLKFEREYPHHARYACEGCGALIEHHHKRAMVAEGAWVAERPGPGRHPSFHIDTLISPFVSWDDLARDFLAAKDDPKKLKAFINLRLGEAWEERGNAPDSDRLMALREDYERRAIPAGALVVTVGVDVQLAGIFYEVVAWGPGKTSWSIDYGYLPGNTSDPFDPVWKALDELRARKYADAYGNSRECDAFGIDAKYNTTAVAAWVRRWPQHNTFALNGDDGWRKPAISPPSKAARGASGLRPWHVGTYDIKSGLYESLHKKGLAEGQPADPPGYCHFAGWHDGHFFGQLTAEHVEVQETGLGYRKVVWVKPSGRENHFLDCRVYATAMAEAVTFNDKMGISVFTDDDWRALAAIRSVPPLKVQADLFDRMGIEPPPTEEATRPPAPVPAAEAAPRQDWIREPQNWRF